MPMPKSNIMAMREQRAELAEKCRALLAKVTRTEEDARNFDTMMAESDQLKAKIDDEERLTKLETELGQPQAGDRRIRLTADPVSGDDRAVAERHMEAFRNWLKDGDPHLSAEDRAILMGLTTDYDALDPTDKAAISAIRAQQGTTPGSAGGFIIPDEAMRPLVEALKAFGGVAEFATTITTQTGADLPIPSDDDTAQKGQIIAENTLHADQTITFGQVVLSSFLYSSKIVKVSVQLMDDAFFDFSSYVMRKLGQRLGRILADHWISGTGAGQPNGILTAGTSALTSATGAAVTYDELVDLMHAVDPAYQINGRWVFNFKTLGSLRKIKTTDNLPIWGPGMQFGSPDTLLGKPYVVDQSMPDIAINNKAVVYGDLSNYHIRLVRGVRMLRLVERFAELGQVGFLGFMRADGDLVDAGTNPVKFITQAAA